MSNRHAFFSLSLNYLDVRVRDGNTSWDVQQAVYRACVQYSGEPAAAVLSRALSKVLVPHTCLGTWSARLNCWFTCVCLFTCAIVVRKVQVSLHGIAAQQCGSPVIVGHRAINDCEDNENVVTVPHCRSVFDMV